MLQVKELIILGKLFDVFDYMILNATKKIISEKQAKNIHYFG
jgi:hypothetical protein